MGSNLPVYGFDWIQSIIFDLKNGTTIGLFGDELRKLSQMDKSNGKRQKLNYIMNRLRSADIYYIDVITKENPSDLSSDLLSHGRNLSRSKMKKKRKKKGQRSKRRQQTKRTQAKNMSSTGIIDRNIRQWTQQEYEKNAEEMKNIKQKMALLESKLFEGERVSEPSDLSEYTLKLSELEKRNKEQQEELEKNKKIIKELEEEKEEALCLLSRMKAMNENLEKEANEMKIKLLEKQNVIDQMNDRYAVMEEERDLFASNLEEIIVQKHASIDDNSINEKEKTEDIQKIQESFLKPNNGNLVWIMKMAAMTASEMNGFNENKMKK